MVSNASEDFPEPESPVKTMSFSLGSSTVRFFRLCSRAPLMSIESVDKFSPGRLSYHTVIRTEGEHLFAGSESESGGRAHWRFAGWTDSSAVVFLHERWIAETSSPFKEPTPI